MYPKEIINLLSLLLKPSSTSTSQLYASQDGSKKLEVRYFKTSHTFNVLDTATNFRWQFEAIEYAAYFIKNYLEPDTNNYVSYTIKARK